MKIIQRRVVSNNDASGSIVLVDDKFVCFFIEDEHREEKLAKETRIPAGRYPISLKTHGGFHERYKIKFHGIHQGMLWLRKVPRFSDILIHCGNFESETDGCLLTNTGLYADPVNIYGQASIAAYKRFYPLVVKAAKNENLWIEIMDDDLRGI